MNAARRWPTKAGKGEKKPRWNQRFAARTLPTFMGACRHERRLIARVRGSSLIFPPRRLTQRAGVSTWNKAGRFLSRCCCCCCCRQRVCVCVCSRRRYWWWYRCWCAGNVTILQTWPRCTWAIAKSKEVIGPCKCKGASIDFADKSKGHRRGEQIVEAGEGAFRR